MGNNKEKFKKSLGITEYPWSSDDDDDVELASGKLRFSRREPHTSVDGMAGTSGINGVQTASEQTSAATARKIQAKRDIDYYWSLINNTEDKRRLYRELNEPPCRTDRSLIDLASLDLNSFMPGDNRSRSVAVPASSYSVPQVSTGLAPSLSTTLPSSPRTVASTSHTAQNSPRIASSTYHVAPNFGRNMFVTSHIAHPHFSSSVPASTSATHTHSRASPGRTLPSISRSASSTSNAQVSTAGMSTSQFRILPQMPLSPLQLQNQVAEARHIYKNEIIRRAVSMLPQKLGSQHVLRYHFNISEPASATGNGPNRIYYSKRRYGTDQIYDSNQGFSIDQLNDSNQIYGTEHIHGTNQINGANQDAINNGTDQADSQQPALPVVPKTESRNEIIENPGGESAEVDMSSNNASSSSGGRVIAGVVEAYDETGNASRSVIADEQINDATAENTTNVATLAVHKAALSEPGPSHQGVKRKRESNDDSREPLTIHDFNQNLLRLLECPVCLEWIEPPIAQCRRGHLVCANCRARISLCPVCRTPFSSVRNRAMEGVAELVRYPCRHACGRDVRLRRRCAHEASCGARRYHCPAPACAARAPLPRDDLAHHFQCKHLPILKIGPTHKFSMKVNAEQHDTWLIMALDEYFHLRVDVDVSTWGVTVYVNYIGPENKASQFYYKVTIRGQHNSRRLVYSRTTHSDLENSSENVSRQDCFHLTLDQALNFLRVKNRHCEPDKFLDFDLEITKSESSDESREDSD